MMYGRNQQSTQHCKAFILHLKHKNNTDLCNSRGRQISNSQGRSAGWKLKFVLYVSASLSQTSLGSLSLFFKIFSYLEEAHPLFVSKSSIIAVY